MKRRCLRQNTDAGAYLPLGLVGGIALPEPPALPLPIPPVERSGMVLPDDPDMPPVPLPMLSAGVPDMPPPEEAAAAPDPLLPAPPSLDD